LIYQANLFRGLKISPYFAALNWAHTKVWEALHYAMFVWLSVRRSNDILVTYRFLMPNFWSSQEKYYHTSPSVVLFLQRKLSINKSEHYDDNHGRPEKFLQRGVTTATFCLPHLFDCKPRLMNYFSSFRATYNQGRLTFCSLIGNPGNNAYNYNCLLFIIIPYATKYARNGREENTKG